MVNLAQVGVNILDRRDKNSTENVLLSVRKIVEEFTRDIRVTDNIGQSYRNNLKPLHDKVDEYLNSVGAYKTGSSLWADAHDKANDIYLEYFKSLLTKRHH